MVVGGETSDCGDHCRPEIFDPVTGSRFINFTDTPQIPLTTSSIMIYCLKNIITSHPGPAYPAELVFCLKGKMLRPILVEKGIFMCFLIYNSV